ncbi:hypothetical protein ACTFIU_003642 [Dictyostelium citrinum]
MLKTNSIIISISFLIFSLSSVAKSSNYLYSITYSNTPNSWSSYTPAFLSFDGSKLILVGNIETSSTPFFVLDTIKWTKSMFMVPYTWNDETLSTYTFFNYL